MKLNKIKLENIRSYLNSEISFPENITLLSGDIGSGKSTILLAIDFALFGIRRGELSGNSLLRNGENNGAVELGFSIDDKEVTIKRTLKRESKSVVQSSGYIVINNEKKDGTAIELKQSILDLLCYPKELLMKSKSLIYRYTVYTPQEEMKQILLGDKDYRLDTLRRVFGIDKYKKIKDNTWIYTNYLKGKKKELEGKTFDLDEKDRLKREKTSKLEEKEISIKNILPRLNEVSLRLENKKKESLNIEKEITKFRNLEKEYENVKVNLELKSENIERFEKQLPLLEEAINKIKSNLNEEEFDKDKLNNVRKKINDSEAKIDYLRKEINEAEIKKRNSEETKEKISRLSKCPTCKQNVSEEYKMDIFSRLDKEISDSNIIIEDKTGLLEVEVKRLGNFKVEFDSLRANEARVEALKLKKQNLEEKIKQKQILVDEANKLKNEIDKLRLQESNFKNELQRFSSFEEKYGFLRKEIDKILEERNKIEIEKAGIDQEIKSLKEIIVILVKEIDEKLKIKKELGKLSKIQQWLENYFVNIVEIIERKVMLRVHSEFSNLFEKWFKMLIEDELMSVSLDEEFTPRIEQNNHDIDYLFLSGGEKTAAALAYRLALNQVINGLVSVIKTKDLLILDEPTDGFSYEQLERMEKVLHELDIKQILLVSHESRIEGFVDNVVKLKKDKHITGII